MQFGGNIFRLLGFFDHTSLVILTNGFAKKTQKTPPREIKLAEHRKADHLEQKRQLDSKTKQEDDHE